MLLIARPLTRLVLIVSLVPTHAVAQTLPIADLSDHTRQEGIVSLIEADTVMGSPSVALAAGPLEGSARRAAQQLAQAQSQPSGSRKKPLLWTGAVLLGVGIGAIAVGEQEVCTIESSPYYSFNYCARRPSGGGWVGSGLIAAIVGSVVLAIGAQRSTIAGPVSDAGPVSTDAGPVPPDAGQAQRKAIPVVALARYMNIGDVVSITEIDGRRTEGRVAELTRSSLTLLVNNVDTQTFPLATVRRVTVKDSVWDGALIGFIGGTIMATPLWTSYAASETGCGRTSCLPVGLFWGIITGGLPGLGIGAAVDAVIQRTVDVSPSLGARLTVSPVISTARKAVLVSIRF
jgi:hypothetical protein